MKITPVLLVTSVEQSLSFWVDRMGWLKVAEVPDGDHLGFAMLVREGTELMLQTLASARKDEAQFAGGEAGSRSNLFIEVDDWPDTLARLAGYSIAMPERDTFYGMHELGVFEPNGHVVMFAIPQTKLHR